MKTKTPKTIEPRTFKVGDKVEVLCPGLAMLRSMMPGCPPNHHGTVAEILSADEVLVEFPLSGKDHSQVAPYPKNMVRLRSD